MNFYSPIYLDGHQPTRGRLVYSVRKREQLWGFKIRYVIKRDALEITVAMLYMQRLWRKKRPFSPKRAQYFIAGGQPRPPPSHYLVPRTASQKRLDRSLYCYMRACMEFLANHIRQIAEEITGLTN